MNERAIRKLLATGLAAPDVAAALGVSVDAVEAVVEADKPPRVTPVERAVAPRVSDVEACRAINAELGRAATPRASRGVSRRRMGR